MITHIIFMLNTYIILKLVLLFENKNILSSNFWSGEGHLLMIWVHAWICTQRSEHHIFNQSSFVWCGCGSYLSLYINLHSYPPVNLDTPYPPFCAFITHHQVSYWTNLIFISMLCSRVWAIATGMFNSCPKIMYRPNLASMEIHNILSLAVTTC